jgi:diguanylate cyclase (GGDEF)-like protein
MVAAFSFGFLGAYLLEKSNKSVFLTHIKLEEAAVTDKLTGLYNRGKLDEFLYDAFQNSRDSFALILIDIDDFKYINDNYGHLTGDKILEKLSALLKADLLPTDKIIRWGGEEFMIISHHTTYEKISRQVEGLCQKVQAYDFEIKKNITISIGFTLSTKTDTTDSIIRRADTALYIAKHSGKNCIKFLEN